MKEGDQVVARHGGQGKWFPGTVGAVHGDGTYDLTYEDGDKETKVAQHRIRRKEDKARALFSDGDVVDVRHGGGKKYFPGKIEKSNGDGTYSVVYDDGDKETAVAHELIEGAYAQSASNSPVNSLAEAAAETREEAEINVNTNTKESKEKKEQPSESESEDKLAEGQRIECRHSGGKKFYPGKIAGCEENGTYNIAYDDGDKESGVQRELIKAVSEPAKARHPAPADSKPVEKDKPEAPAAVGVLKDGEKAEARHGGQGKWFGCAVDKVHGDGSADLTYDDGDKEKKVGRHRIRRKGDTARKELAMGEAVDARHGGGKKLFAGKVTKVHADGSCDITYSDGDKETKVARKLIEGACEGKVKAAETEPPADTSEKVTNEKKDEKKAATAGLIAAAAELGFDKRKEGGGDQIKTGTDQKAEKVEEREEQADGADARVVSSLKEAAAEIQREDDEQADDEDGGTGGEGLASSQDITAAVLRGATKDLAKEEKKGKGDMGGGMDVEGILKASVLETSADDGDDGDDLNKSVEDVLKEATAEVNNNGEKGVLKKPLTEVEKMAQKLVTSTRNKKAGRSVEFALDEDEEQRREDLAWRRSGSDKRRSRSRRSSSPKRISRKKAEKELRKMGVDAPPCHHDGKIAYRDFVHFITADDDPASGVEEDDELANKIRRRLRRRYDVNLPRLFRRLDPSKTGFVFARDFMKLLKALELRLTSKEIRCFTRRFDQGAAPEKIQEYRMLVSCVQARAMAPKKSSLKHSRLLTLAQPKDKAVKKSIGEEEVEAEAGTATEETPKTKYAKNEERRHCHFTFKARKDPSGESNNNATENFMGRQETKWRKTQYEYNRRRKEEEYNVRLDKMMCPECGQYQSYDEMTNRKRFCTKCQADDKEIMYTFEGGGWAKVGKRFLRRQDAWEAKREAKMEKLHETVINEYKEWKPEEEDPLFAVTREYGKNEYDEYGAWKGGAHAESKSAGKRGPTPGRASLEAKWGRTKPDIIERTGQWAEAKEARLQSLRKARVDEVMRDCTFEPQLTSDRGSSVAEWKTFNQRMDEDVRYRQARQHRSEFQAEAKGGPSSLVFVPEPAATHPGKHTVPSEDLDYW
jgi:hypothetical protein